MTQLMISHQLRHLHHTYNRSHYLKNYNVTQDHLNQIKKITKMKILDEIKKQVEHEMIKMKKLQPTKARLLLNQQQKNKLIDLVSKGVPLKDAAKQIEVTYHEAKIAYNEFKRKNCHQSETQSQPENEYKMAGVSQLKCLPQHFIIQSVLEQNVVSVRKLYNIILLAPIQ